jgi:hypothetical protein
MAKVVIQSIYPIDNSDNFHAVLNSMYFVHTCRLKLFTNNIDVLFPFSTAHPNNP